MFHHNHFRLADFKKLTPRGPRSIDQCEQEMQRLHSSLDRLRMQISEGDTSNRSSEVGSTSNDEIVQMPTQTVEVRSIISRYD